MQLELHSMEQGICLFAVHYFAFNILSLTLITVVGQLGYKFYHSTVLSPFWVTRHHQSHDHWTHSIWFPIGNPLTPTQYLARFPRYWASSISR